MFEKRELRKLFGGYEGGGNRRLDKVA